MTSSTHLRASGRSRSTTTRPHRASTQECFSGHSLSTRTVSMPQVQFPVFYPGPSWAPLHSTRLMQSDTQMCFIFIWHCSCQSVIDTNLPVISHRTHLRRSRAPLHSEVRTTQPAAWLCTHVSVSTKRIRSHGCCDLSPSGAKPWTDNEPCPAGI